MKAVGIKELKARLSEYVRVARAGEVVLVTDRGEVVAELRPPTRGLPVPDTAEETLRRLAEAGEVTPASLAKGEWTWRVPGVGLPAGSARDLLDELRRDRDGE